MYELAFGVGEARCAAINSIVSHCIRMRNSQNIYRALLNRNGI
jgi:hypothetical protein